MRYIDIPARPGPGARAAGTVVLIHGFPLTARMWEPQHELVEQGWRLVLPQLRGFDGGVGERPVASMDDYAGDVVDLLDRLRIDEAVIGGLSMGGYVTFALLRHAPRYFRGLILADTRSQPDTPEAVVGRDRMLALVRSQGAGAVADDMLPKLLGQTTQRERVDLVDRVRNLVLSNSTEAIAGAIIALKGRPDSTPLLSTIHLPTLIIVGEEDTLTPPAMSESMHRSIGGSELVAIPRAGHMANLEQPAPFNAALVRFLAHRV